MLGVVRRLFRSAGWSRGGGSGRPLTIAAPVPPPNNGVTVFTDLLLRLLTERGVRYRHVDTSDHRAPSTVSRIDSLRVVLTLRYWATAALVIALRPRCYYTPIAQGRGALIRDAVPLLLCRLLRVPRVVHLHGAHFREWVDGSDRATRSLARAALRDARGVVLHDSLRACFEPYTGRKDVWVIENAVADPGPVFREASLPVTVLYLSQVSEAKGAATYLQAAASLEWDRRVRFLLCGDLRPARFLESHPPGAVRYVGPAHTSAQRHLLMAEADIFVLPSFDEGQPLAILEAMAAGLPVVGTRVGAVPATVTHGMGGLLVEPGNREELTEAICRLVDEPALRLKMGAFNRRVYESRFRPERLLSEFLACVDGERP